MSADDERPALPPEPGGRLRRVLLVVAGITLGQFILFGPSLLGRKLLLPLDLLAQTAAYLPSTPEYKDITAHDSTLSDLILQFETERRFVATEYRAGRFPLWLPYQYAGVPLVWPRFSPFLLLACSTPSPRILPWVQLLSSLVAGGGMYLFCRRTLLLAYWPAALASWCYPLTGFFILWQGFPTCGAVYWFPWLLFAVDWVVRARHVYSISSLAIVTALVTTSGHLDVAAQVLIVAGLFSLWRVVRQEMSLVLRAKACGALVFGWALGFGLATPHIWPLLDYTKTSARMERRAKGTEERPPVGISALPEVVLPDVHGATMKPAVWLGAGNQIESPAAGYGGLIATLFAAPLAWFHRRHRSFVGFCAVASFAGMAWSLDVPGVVALLRLPGLNLLSHNRLVFVMAFAVVALSAIAIDALGTARLEWKRWCWMPLALLVLVTAWCGYHALHLPKLVAQDIPNLVAQGQAVRWVHSAADVAQMQAWFVRMFALSAGLGALGAVGWLMLWRGARWSRAAMMVLGLALCGDLLWFGHARRPQCDPALYYPRLPILEQLAKEEPGRVVGYGCLPATLAQTHGLWDIRGYDSVDPLHLVQLLDPVADSQVVSPPYALTQWFAPKIRITEGRNLTLPPILNMLNVRYVVFRGATPAGITPQFVGVDYWALVNRAALPRVFVPERVELVADAETRLRNLSADTFNPRAVAYVETALPLTGLARGEASIVRETPTRVVITSKMETPGLLVLGDAWNPGWRGTVGGESTAVLRVNHYLRGIVVPAGESKVEFQYRPTDFFYGTAIAGAAAAFLMGWLTFVRIRARRRRVIVAT